MNVWIVADILRGLPGGMLRHMESHADGLRRLGHRATMFCAEDLASTGVPAIDARASGARSLARLLPRLRREAPDVVNVHTIPAPAWIAAQRLGLLHKAEVVVMSYGADERTAPREASAVELVLGYHGFCPPGDPPCPAALRSSHCSSRSRLSPRALLPPTTRRMTRSPGRTPARPRRSRLLRRKARRPRVPFPAEPEGLLAGVDGALQLCLRHPGPARDVAPARFFVKLRLWHVSDIALGQLLLGD